ncbi:MAG TPA: zinc ribbon domain-containing protein [Blastocatellia bacterium]|nr:zinc ribbon domain-containing protein [Blastocatellia bacterium]
MFCPKCGKDNYEQVRLCKSCGADLAPVHLAIEGRLPDLSTIMTEEKRRRMLHRGIISTITGGGFLLVLLWWLVFASHILGGALSVAAVTVFALLAVPLLAYGIGSLISGRFVYSRQALDYSQRFDVVREMLEAQRTDELPSSFPPSVTQELVDATRRPVEREQH